MGKKFEVSAIFRAKDLASAQLKKIGAGFRKMTDTIKKSSLAQIAAFGGVAVALRSLVRFMGDSIEKANEQEVAVNQLNAALAELGPSAAAVSQSLQDQASALQKVTTFGDEAIIQAQTMIASFVKQEDQIKAATAATLDFSVAFGIDLKGAAALVSKTLGSSTNALTRYGIEVEGAVGSTERLTSLVDNVAKVAGGRATAAIDTFAGATKQLSNAFGDLQEKIAANLTQNEELIADINELTTALSDAGPGVAKWSARLVELTKSYFQVASASTDAAGFAGLLTEQFIKAEAQGEKLRISQDALEATAKRYGVTVEDLNAALKDGTSAQLAEEAATRKANEALRETAKEAKAAEAALKKLTDDALTETTAALEALADAVDVVTSAELEQELSKMESDLELVRKSAFGVSVEFDAWEDSVVAKIEHTKDRIDSLKNGTGDLADTVKNEATPAVKRFADELDRGALSANDGARALENLTARTIEQTLADNAAIGVTQQLIGSRIQLFDVLGRKVGTRLASTAGLGSGTGLSPFSTGGRSGKTGTDDRGNIRT